MLRIIKEIWDFFHSVDWPYYAGFFAVVGGLVFGTSRDKMPSNTVTITLDEYQELFERKIRAETDAEKVAFSDISTGKYWLILQKKE